MITLEQVIAMALKNEPVMQQLGSALSSDLVCANPFYRRIVSHAADFSLKHGKLPSSGDYQVWFETLETGVMLDGTKEALARLVALDVSGFQPDYFAEVALDQIRKAGAQVLRARLNEMTQVDPAVVAHLYEKYASLSITPADRRLRLFPTLGDLHAANAPDEDEAEAEELIPRLAWRGRHVLLAGREKLGKSTFVAAGAAALTSGGPFLDGTAAHGRVLWFAMDESMGDARPRLLDNGALQTNLAVECPHDPALFLRTWLPEPEQRPDLVVVDSLIEYARRTTHEMPSSGDSAAWAAVMRPLSAFAHDYDVGIVTIHHATKATGEYRDSSEIGAAVDATLTMSPGQEETVRRIHVIPRRSIAQRVSSYSVQLEQETVETYPEPGAVKMVQRDRYVLAAGADPEEQDGMDAEVAKDIEEFVTANPGAKQAQIFAAIDRGQTVVHQAIKALVLQGVIREVKEGKVLNYFPGISPASNDAGGQSQK